MKKKLLGILFLFLANVFLVAEDAGEIYLGFQPMIAKSSFPRFNQKLIENEWGENAFEKAVADRSPYIEIVHNFDRRYFLMSKVEHIDYWNCQLVIENHRAFLAKVQLLFLIWDKAKQREIMRKTVSGYAVSDAKNASLKLSPQLLQKAFLDATSLAAREIAGQFPVTGKVIQSFGGGAKIGVNLGRSHGLDTSDILKIMYEGKQLGSFSVIPASLEAKQCKAFFMGQQIPKIRIGMKVQLIRPVPSILSDRKAVEINIKKVMHIDLKSRQNISPNPLKSLKITTRATFFVGSRLELKAMGRDCYDDLVENPNLQWSIDGKKSDYILHGKYFTPLRQGKFKITTRDYNYGLKAKMTLRIKKIQKLELSPQYKTIPFNKRLRFSCKGRLIGNESIPQDSLPLEWRVHSAEQGVGEISKEGIFIAGDRPGLCTIIAMRKQNRREISENSLYTESQVAVIPSIVSFDLFCDGKKLLPGTVVEAKLTQPRQFSWKLGNKQLNFLALDWNVIPKDCATIDDQGYFTPLKTYKGAKILARIKGAEEKYFPHGMGVQKIVRLDIVEELINALKIEPITQMRETKAREYVCLYEGMPILFQIKAYQKGREILPGELKVQMIGNIGNKYKIERNILQIIPNQPTISKPCSGFIIVNDEKSKMQAIQAIKIVVSDFETPSISSKKARYPAIKSLAIKVATSDISVGQKLKLAVKARGLSGHFVHKYQLYWSCLQNSKAVHNNVFTAPSIPGKYTITVVDRNSSARDALIVNVTKTRTASEQKISRIKIVAPQVVYTGRRYKLHVKGYSKGKWISAIKVKWKLKPKGIAHITSHGRFTTGKKTGKVRITARLKNASHIKDRIFITVVKRKDFKIVTDEDFFVTYRINPKWTKQVSNSQSTKTIYYSIDKNKVGIVFVFGKYTHTLEYLIADSEKAIGKQSLSYYRISADNYNIDNLSGQFIRYLAISKKDHQSYILEFFFAIRKNTSYLVKLWAPEEKFATYSSRLHKTMKSLSLSAQSTKTIAQKEPIKTEKDNRDDIRTNDTDKKWDDISKKWDDIGKKWDDIGKKLDDDYQ